mgnify:FL=1|jgi:hypothetical protein
MIRGAQPHMCGERLPDQQKCRMVAEVHSLSRDGVSRQCLSTVTAHPVGTPVLMTASAGGASVYKALPLPEASAYPS